MDSHAEHAPHDDGLIDRIVSAPTLQGRLGRWWSLLIVLPLFLGIFIYKSVQSQTFQWSALVVMFLFGGLMTVIALLLIGVPIAVSLAGGYARSPRETAGLHMGTIRAAEALRDGGDGPPGHEA